MGQKVVVKRSLVEYTPGQNLVVCCGPKSGGREVYARVGVALGQNLVVKRSVVE